MGCNNLGPELLMKGFGDSTPIGNTYEITIGPYDKIIVNVEHEHLRSSTLINHIGIYLKEDKDGSKNVLSDFNFHNNQKYIEYNSSSAMNKRD